MSRLDRDRAATSLTLKIMLPVVVWWTIRFCRGERWLISCVGACALLFSYVILLAWSDWARTERSRDRRRGLLCLYVGHSLPERSHAWTRSTDSIEDFRCRRCGRGFQTPRRCDVCHQVTNESEVP